MMKDENEIIKITLREALESTQKTPPIYRGWLFLPSQPWTLETIGTFFDLDKNNKSQHDQTPEDIKSKKLTLTLDSDLIEDVISNARAQRPNVTTNELLAAFTYYCDNDAFLKFEKCK